MFGTALTPAQLTHVALIRRLAQGFADLPVVPKDGTALLLCYGLDRFSEDLDFDAPKRFNVATRVERLLQGVATHQEVRVVKDTETVQRLKVHDQTREGIQRLLLGLILC
jgi:predicted nucleotidyltransferase component of viral defense system